MNFVRRIAIGAGAGLALVVAGCDDATGVAPGVVSLQITPRDTSIVYGSSFRIVVVAVDAAGNAVARQPAISFEFDRLGIVSIDADGLVTTQQPGTVNVTARLAKAPSDPRVGRTRIAVGLNALGQ